MAYIQLTEDELTYVKRAVAKLMLIRKTLPPNDWKKPQNKLVRELSVKFPEEATSERSFILNRTCTKALLQLTEAGSKALTEATIPGYEKRIAENVDKASFYQPYLDKAKAMLIVFNGLTVKLERTL